ncbi:hypothetical protein SAMN04488700_2372 [Carnobacterium iners]|uniref:DUF1033 domain-containing protein n=1 Tax=Carnobacterium iners TaxID=1073423 RepID=A0A1X7NR03_9LACT|nr:DUF1033 family protein [Carnobacterium iners]SEK25615.1 hypothetical protein SAMN04488114_1022 [Carnobacterium iners]SMH40512.1 hypothetical protein SAMN04488700_2372 [Carnobacterium iners]
MFQVIELQGEYEPWWFFDDWKEQISQIKTFEIFDEALIDYQKKFELLYNEFPSYQTKKQYLAAFWDDEQNEYCPECEDDIQLFHSVMLLKEYNVIE